MAALRLLQLILDGKGIDGSESIVERLSLDEDPSTGLSRDAYLRVCEQLCAPRTEPAVRLDVEPLVVSDSLYEISVRMLNAAQTTDLVLLSGVGNNVGE